MLINVISSYPLHTNFARSQSARLQRNWIVTATDNKRVVGMLMLLSDAALLIDVSVGRGGLERGTIPYYFLRPTGRQKQTRITPHTKSSNPHHTSHTPPTAAPHHPFCLLAPSCSTTYRPSVRSFAILERQSLVQGTKS